MINLKTHLVYPELQELPNNVISIKLLSGKGKTVFEDLVVGSTLTESKEKAAKLIDTESNKYVRR